VKDFQEIKSDQTNLYVYPREHYLIKLVVMLKEREIKKNKSNKNSATKG
jgi:hypothetical protein